eukprot:Nk52_evm1s32 gene=Nk52_evmTU1s32
MQTAAAKECRPSDGLYVKGILHTAVSGNNVCLWGRFCDVGKESIAFISYSAISVYDLNERECSQALSRYNGQSSEQNDNAVSKSTSDPQCPEKQTSSATGVAESEVRAKATEEMVYMRMKSGIAEELNNEEAYSIISKLNDRPVMIGLELISELRGCPSVEAAVVCPKESMENFGFVSISTDGILCVIKDVVCLLVVDGGSEDCLSAKNLEEPNATFRTLVQFPLYVFQEDASAHRPVKFMACNQECSLAATSSFCGNVNFINVRNALRTSTHRFSGDTVRVFNACANVLALQCISRKHCENNTRRGVSVRNVERFLILTLTGLGCAYTHQLHIISITDDFLTYSIESYYIPNSKELGSGLNERCDKDPSRYECGKPFTDFCEQNEHDDTLKSGWESYVGILAPKDVANGFLLICGSKIFLCNCDSLKSKKDLVGQNVLCLSDSILDIDADVKSEAINSISIISNGCRDDKSRSGMKPHDCEIVCSCVVNHGLVLQTRSGFVFEAFLQWTSSDGDKISKRRAVTWQQASMLRTTSAGRLCLLPFAVGYFYSARTMVPAGPNTVLLISDVGDGAVLCRGMSTYEGWNGGLHDAFALEGLTLIPNCTWLDNISCLPSNAHFENNNQQDGALGGSCILTQSSSPPGRPDLLCTSERFCKTGMNARKVTTEIQRHTLHLSEELFDGAKRLFNIVAGDADGDTILVISFAEYSKVLLFLGTPSNVDTVDLTDAINFEGSHPTLFCSSMKCIGAIVQVYPYGICCASYSNFSGSVEMEAITKYVEGQPLQTPSPCWTPSDGGCINAACTMDEYLLVGISVIDMLVLLKFNGELGNSSGLGMAACIEVVHSVKLDHEPSCVELICLGHNNFGSEAVYLCVAGTYGKAVQGFAVGSQRVFSCNLVLASDLPAIPNSICLYSGNSFEQKGNNGPDSQTELHAKLVNSHFLGEVKSIVGLRDGLCGFYDSKLKIDGSKLEVASTLVNIVKVGYSAAVITPCKALGTKVQPFLIVSDQTWIVYAGENFRKRSPICFEEPIVCGCPFLGNTIFGTNTFMFISGSSLRIVALDLDGSSGNHVSVTAPFETFSPSVICIGAYLLSKSYLLYVLASKANRAELSSVCVKNIKNGKSFALKPKGTKKEAMKFEIAFDCEVEIDDKCVARSFVCVSVKLSNEKSVLVVYSIENDCAEEIYSSVYDLENFRHVTFCTSSNILSVYGCFSSCALGDAVHTEPECSPMRIEMKFVYESGKLALKKEMLICFMPFVNFLNPRDMIPLWHENQYVDQYENKVLISSFTEGPTIFTIDNDCLDDENGGIIPQCCAVVSGSADLNIFSRSGLIIDNHRILTDGDPGGNEELLVVYDQPNPDQAPTSYFNNSGTDDVRTNTPVKLQRYHLTDSFAVPTKGVRALIPWGGRNSDFQSPIPQLDFLLSPSTLVRANTKSLSNRWERICDCSNQPPSVPSSRDDGPILIPGYTGVSVALPVKRHILDVLILLEFTMSSSEYLSDKILESPNSHFVEVVALEAVCSRIRSSLWHSLTQSSRFSEFMKHPIPETCWLPRGNKFDEKVIADGTFLTLFHDLPHRRRQEIVNQFIRCILCENIGERKAHTLTHSLKERALGSAELLKDIPVVEGRDQDAIAAFRSFTTEVFTAQCFDELISYLNDMCS